MKKVIVVHGSPRKFADITPRNERFFRIGGGGEPSRYAGHQMDKIFAQARVLASDVVA